MFLIRQYILIARSNSIGIYLNEICQGLVSGTACIWRIKFIYSFGFSDENSITPL